MQKEMDVLHGKCTGVVLQQNVQERHRCEESKSQYDGKECFCNGTTMYTHCWVIVVPGLKRS